MKIKIVTTERILRQEGDEIISKDKNIEIFHTYFNRSLNTNTGK